MHEIGFVGAVDIKQLLEEMSAQLVDPTTQRLKWLLDLRSAQLDLRPIEALEVARQLDKRKTEEDASQSCRVAMLVTDDLTYGNCRVLQGFLGNQVELTVTRSEEHARHWLAPLH